MRLAAVGALLALLALPAAPRLRLDSNPKPPSQAQINAAENQARQREAALNAENGKLSAASAALAKLQNQAEVLTERYDEVLVNEQRAEAAYQVTEKRLNQAQREADSSQQRLAALAEEEFESGGGFDPVTSMLGDASGPQAYMNQVGMGEVLAQGSTDTLAANKANDVVERVFRNQAHELLVAQQSDLRAADDLKVAIQAEVSTQLTFVHADQVQKNQLAHQLASAQSQAANLKAQRQSALAAEAAAAAARAAAAAGSPQNSGSASSWSASSGASSTQGDEAANWALTQLGKPYLWGGAGPDSYDCSGLTMMAWAQVGVHLLHYTGYQWEEGPHVSLDDLQRGDLLFYATDNADPATIHHVGIYIGNGMMVDAPYTGAFVRIDSIYQPGVPIGAVDPAA